MIAGVIALALVLAVGPGCAGGDGDGGGGTRQDYVAALVDASSEAEGGTLTADQETCFAEAIVDAVGVERLADEVSPDEIREEGNTSVVDLGVEVDESDGAAYYESVSQCADLRAVLVQSEVGTAEITDAATACFERNLTDDLIRELFETGFTRTRAELADDTDLVGRLEAVFTECAAQ
ncbi:MAG: hypothetical protein ACRD2C_13040 [Acidimicrobiales bacterium]